MATVVNRSERWSVAAAASSVVSAVIASICCVGPLLFALLGIGGLGFVAKLEPYRLPLTALTFALLGTGFWLSYRRPKPATGESCEVCEVPRVSRAGRVMLWVATTLVIAFLAFPYLPPYLFPE